jgi:hypothetical protein
MQPYTTNRSLRRALRRAGIGPRRVRRLLGEWDEHARDLAAQLCEQGLPADVAEAQAQASMGTWQHLAASVTQRDDLRAFSRRLPWLAFVVTPVALLIALVLGAAFSVALMAWGFQGAGLPVPDWYAGVQSMLFWAVRGVVPLLLAAVIALVAARRHSPAFWPLLGMFIVLGLGAAVELSAELDRLTAVGSVAVSLSFLPPFPEVWGFLSRLALGVGVVVVPYLTWRKGTSAEA